VHVVERGADTGDLYEERLDGDDFDAVVAAFGGQILGIHGESTDLAALAEVTLGLVRPIRIDNFEIVAEGADGAAIEAFAGAEPTLQEGEGFRSTEIATAAVKTVVLRGRLWGRRIERRLAVDASYAAHLPALVFGGDLASDLFASEAEQLGLAAGVVTPYTSFLAEHAEAEPSTVGFDEGQGGWSSSSCGGSHCGGVIGCSGIPTVRVGTAKVDPDWSARLAAWMAPGVAACARAHGVARLGAHVTVEATDDEIVGVTLRIDGPADAAARSCVEDAVWAVRLDADFRGHRDYVTDVNVDAESASQPATPATPAKAAKPANATTPAR
jgi:hypothetical protein